MNKKMLKVILSLGMCMTAGNFLYGELPAYRVAEPVVVPQSKDRTEIDDDQSQVHPMPVDEDVENDFAYNFTTEDTDTVPPSPAVSQPVRERADPGTVTPNTTFDSQTMRGQGTVPFPQQTGNDDEDEDIPSTVQDDDEEDDAELTADNGMNSTGNIYEDDESFDPNEDVELEEEIDQGAAVPMPESSSTYETEAGQEASFPEGYDSDAFRNSEDEDDLDQDEAVPMPESSSTYESREGQETSFPEGDDSNTFRSSEDEDDLDQDEVVPMPEGYKTYEAVEEGQEASFPEGYDSSGFRYSGDTEDEELAAYDGMNSAMSGDEDDESIDPNEDVELEEATFQEEVVPMPETSSTSEEDATSGEEQESSFSENDDNDAFRSSQDEDDQLAQSSLTAPMDKTVEGEIKNTMSSEGSTSERATSNDSTVNRVDTTVVPMPMEGEAFRDEVVTQPVTPVHEEAVPASPTPVVTPMPVSVQERTTTTTLGNVFRDDIKKFSIEFPSDWEVKRGVAGVDVIAISPLESADDKFRENINIGSQMIQGGIDINEFYRRGEKTLSEQLPGFRLLNQGETTINGLGARWLEFFQTTGNIESNIIQYYIISADGTKGFIITGAAPPEKLEVFRPIFQKVVQTFRLE